MIDSLVSCIIEAESAGKADAISPVGAVGLMQIMPATWKEWAPIAGVSEDTPMTDPDANKKIGTAYIKFLLKRYDDNIPLALAAYNWGLGHIDHYYKTLGSGVSIDDLLPFVPNETKKYITKIANKLKSAKAT